MNVAAVDMIEVAADGCIAQIDRLMPAVKRVDQRRQARRLPCKTGEGKIAVVRYDFIEQGAGIAGRTLPLEYHVGPDRFETLDPLPHAAAVVTASGQSRKGNG